MVEKVIEYRKTYRRDSTKYRKDSTKYRKDSTKYRKDSTKYRKDSTKHRKNVFILLLEIMGVNGTCPQI